MWTRSVSKKSHFFTSSLFNDNLIQEGKCRKKYIKLTKKDNISANKSKSNQNLYKLEKFPQDVILYGAEDWIIKQED